MYMQTSQFFSLIFDAEICLDHLDANMKPWLGGEKKSKVLTKG